METEVLLRVTLLCIVSNNSYTNVGNIGNITKSFLVYFYTNLIIRVLTNIGVLINSYLSKNSREKCLPAIFCHNLTFPVFFWRLLNGWVACDLISL